MKKLLLSVSFVLLTMVMSYAQDKPAASPASTVTQKVGLTDVTIEYSRPSLKGRDMYEALTPVDKLWRTGANAGTKFIFSTDVKVEGTEVPAGEYLIYTIPGKSEWTVMLYKDTALGGRVTNYDESKELARWTVEPVELAMKIETLTFGVGDISKESTSASIMFMWENTAWMLNLEVPETW